MAQYAIADANRVPAITFHSGTADTANVIRATGETTGGLHVHVTGGTVQTGASVTVGTIPEVTNIVSGTLADVTVTDMQDGAGDSIMDAANDAMRVNVVAGGAGGGVADLQVRDETGTTWADVGFGTGAAGTFNVPVHVRLGTVSVGSIANIGQVHNAGTVAALPNIPGGTLGLVTQVSTIPNVAKIHDAGTIAALPNIPGGTVGVVSSVSNLVTGTISRILGGTMTNSGTVTGVGVVTSITNLAAGTITRLAQGSINVTAGTINTGTVNILGGTIQSNPKPSRSILTYGTRVTQGTAEFTLVAAPGAGTQVYINELSVINSGTTANGIYIGYGTSDAQGASSIIRGIFGANGGQNKVGASAYNANKTNLALLGTLDAAGTYDITLSYWVE